MITKEAIEAAMDAYREGMYLTDDQVLASVTAIITAAFAAMPATDLQAENERLREALEWYGEQAAATFRLKAIPDALMAIVVALSLDGGKRAKEALERT